MWLYLSLELVYIGLLLISCTLLSVQLCIRAWFPSTQRWGQLLNAFAAVFTVLGGAVLDVIVSSIVANKAIYIYRLKGEYTTLSIYNIYRQFK